MGGPPHLQEAGHLTPFGQVSWVKINEATL
jgi:hypothetical protein